MDNNYVYCLFMRGVRFSVGTVYLPSFASFARDSKWGCRLYITSLLKGRKTQTNKQIFISAVSIMLATAYSRPYVFHCPSKYTALHYYTD